MSSKPLLPAMNVFHEAGDGLVLLAASVNQIGREGLGGGHRSTRGGQVEGEGDGGEARETLGPTSAGDDDDALTSGRPNLALRVDRP